MHTYTPDKYVILLGVPPAAVTITNWTDIKSSKAVKRFNFLQGVVSNEPFIDYIGNTSRVFSFELLQTSPQVAQLRELLRAQEFGILGLPLTFIDNGSDSNTDQDRQKSFYLAFIEDEPEESYSMEGATWVFNITAVYGQTIYYMPPSPF